MNNIRFEKVPLPDLAPIWPDVLAASSYAMPPEAVLWLWHDLRRRKPTRILEMGCGLSTLLFALYAKLDPEREVRIASLEHDPLWLQNCADQLKKHDIAGSARMIHAPIVALEKAEPARYSYSPDAVQKALADLGNAPDLVLIDGPPAHLCGRRETLPAVWSSVSGQGRILVDDACRSDEFRFCIEWRRRFGSLLFWQGIVPVGQGIAVFRKM